MSLKFVRTYSKKASEFSIVFYKEFKADMTVHTEYANKADMQVPCDYNGEDINIGFSSKFLTEMLSVLSSDDITMKISQPNRPGIIEPIDGLEAEENILMLSMPVIGM